MCPTCSEDSRPVAVQPFTRERPRRDLHRHPAVVERWPSDSPTEKRRKGSDRITGSVLQQCETTGLFRFHVRRGGSVFWNPWGEIFAINEDDKATQ